MMKVLSPGMEHRQKTDPGAQMLWVGGNLQQGLGRGAEQDGVNHPLVLEGQGRERLRQREDHMKVLNRQKLGGTLLKPCRPGCAPGTSGNGDCGRNNRRSFDGRNGRIVRRGRRGRRCGRPRSLSALSFAERRANLQTPRDKLDRGCGKCRPAPAPAPSSSRIRVNRLGQSIQRADGRTHRQVGNVQIPGRGLQVTMPHQNLDAAQIGRLFQQMGGEAMPQGVGRYGFGQMRGCRAPACRCARPSLA